MIAFGPVPSRRLGRSLGINNIPPKVCSYSCLYCQVGRTQKLRIDRTEFYSPKQLFNEVRNKVEEVQKNGEHIDYLSFVPDGEPTLDIHLREEILDLKRLGIKIAVITNGSLLWQKDVRSELLNADWVSIKADSMNEKVWHDINRPQRKLKLANIQEGIISFANEFKNILVTETMLVRGINDSESHLRELANFLANVKPHIAYLSVPTRPPAEEWVQSPDENTLLQAYEILREKIFKVELLIGYEGDNFTACGNLESDLLSITAVHPMQERALNRFLNHAGEDWSLIRKLVKEKKLKEIYYNAKKFYLRNIKN